MFCSWIKPTHEETIIREKLQEKLFKTIRSCCGDNCRPVVFGSMTTKLYLPTSDIDIVVLDIEGGSNYWLYKLADTLLQNSQIENFKLLPEAKVQGKNNVEIFQKIFTFFSFFDVRYQ